MQSSCLSRAKRKASFSTILGAFCLLSLMLWFAACDGSAQTASNGNLYLAVPFTIGACIPAFTK
jgi:hypothetical protein